MNPTLRVNKNVYSSITILFMKLKTLLTLLALFAFNGMMAQTTVPPVISSDQIWNFAGSPYKIDKNTIIDTGVSVKVLPGTVIIGAGDLTTLAISGEFQILGNSDSLVKISGLIMNYKENSVDYDPTTGKGAYVRFAEIEGNGTGKRVFDLHNTHFNIEDSRIYAGYYAINSRNDYKSKTFITIKRCHISGITSGNYYSGEVTRISGDSVLVVIDSCLFDNARTMDIDGGLDMRNSVVYNLNSVYIKQKTDIKLECNSFIKLVQGVRIMVYGRNPNHDVEVLNNTFDSLNTASTTNSLFSLYRITDLSMNPSFTIRKNNFLKANKKVVLLGSNPNPATTNPVDFQSNYWGTTDTLKIDSSIQDWNDDINIFGSVDYSNYLSSIVPPCNSDVCPTPNFSFEVDGFVVTFKDSSKGKGTFGRVWKFGDNKSTTSTGGSVTHKYAGKGVFTVCLYVLNSRGVVCDSICKKVATNNKSFCSASFYVARDTTEKFNMYIVNNSTVPNKNTQFSWDFGDGSGSNQKTPTHKYLDFGNYELCLTITDPATNCSSEYCDTIGMDSDGKYYKGSGFTIGVLNHVDISSVNKLNLQKNSTLYPNPSTGLFTLEMNLDEPAKVNISIITTLGQKIYNTEQSVQSGLVALPIDISNQKNGFYIINITADDQVIRRHLILNK
jgi:PKD repeat protein